MPSIQTGSSSISGSGFALTGPAGNTGPIGETGNIGLLGITAGITGATGVYIKQVTTSINPLSAGVYFYLSNGVTIGPISGFTGPSITYYNSKGISGSFASDYFNAFIGISGGMTFVFRGICGDGQYTRTSLSSDGTEIILTISDIPSGSVLLGTTSDDFITFTNSNYTATNSRIRVQSQTSEDDLPTSSFKSVFNYGILEFGLTANPDINPVSEVKTFVDFTTPFININGLNRNFTPGSVPITDGIKKVDSGGYVLDLDKSSVFKLTTPIGITAFSRKRADNQSRSWLFFIEGSDVWNFPQNVQFESGISGIENYAFGSGMNILRIETPMSGDLSNYNASFVDRFFGSDVSVDYGGIGSCCYSGGCDDYVTREFCEGVRSGTFNSLISCENSCRVGSCCIDGTCHDTVSETVCTTAGGVWNAQTCSLRGPCNLYYILETVEPAVTTQNIVINNTTPLDKKTVAIFRAKTNDSSVIIRQPRQYSDSNNGIVNGQFFIKDISGNYDDTNGEYTINNPTGTEGITFALQFDNNYDAVLSGIIYTPSDFVIQMKDSSGVVKTSLTYKVKAEYVSSCAGRPNSKLIKSEWLAKRYCRDCYTQDSNGYNYFYPVQSQYGSCDFCVDMDKVGTDYTVTPVCIITSDVEDNNDCTDTKENDFSTDPSVAATCKHSEWDLNSSIDNCSGDCGSILDIILDDGTFQAGCKGISLDNQEKYPYWHNTTLKNPSKLYENLNSVGITLVQDQNSIVTFITNFIESSNNTENQKSVLFTQENENKGITFITPTELATCCPAKDDIKLSSTVLDFTDATSDVRYFVIYTGYYNSYVCEGQIVDPKIAGSCRVYGAERYIYALIFKTYFIPGTNLVDTDRTSCLVDIINTEASTQSCSSGANFKCVFSDCKHTRNNEFSVDNITEIKIGDTTEIPGSTGRNLILSRNSRNTPTCNGRDYTEYYYDLAETNNWYTSRDEYVTVEAQLKQIFWYPMFCGDCGTSSVAACDGTECKTACFAGNGSIFKANSGFGANVDCSISPTPTEYRQVSIETSNDGSGNTILTPRIYGDIPAVEKTDEYFYYSLGQPSDLSDPSTLYMWTCDGETRIKYKIQIAPSGTPIVIPTSTLQNNEFVVYYTNGENVPFYNFIVDGCSTTVRNAPVRIVKKYKHPDSTIPEIDFTADVITDYALGYFSATIRTNCSPSNSNCISVDDGGFYYYIAGTNWKLDGYQVNFWFEYDGQIINYTTQPTSSFDSGSVTQSILSTDLDQIYFSKVPTTGYSNSTNVNIYTTVIISLQDAIDGSYRTVEKTRVISVPRTPISLTGSQRRLNKYKLITDENGNSQCVLMDCSVTEDCNTLPDC